MGERRTVPHVDGYTLGEPLCSVLGAELYRAVREADGRSVLMRIDTLDASGNPQAPCAGFDRVGQLSGSGVPVILDHVNEGSVRAVVLEDFSGSSLVHWAMDSPPSVASVLALARALGESLDQLHRQGVWFGALSPAHIL